MNDDDEEHCINCGALLTTGEFQLCWYCEDADDDDDFEDDYDSDDFDEDLDDDEDWDDDDPDDT